ncbi:MULTISPECIES: triphosphoribosyl-dephospho-CoA synthase [Pseudomonas]|uniref:Probable 2-(5''-triphosphoribosyl)-3'-dephosphocoenzyme-A synthase n=1 Tax=Pseudomonas lutea TaxID=243924 RepID=A0A9X8QL28_9PSED|nr:MULTISPECIES: triphosphoribosyl-dephospho-CoA synthase [Pseudomonas]SER15755.1 triphosphoribosyl-dephospho-CoA synthase [Pseudomonas lutea]
MRALIAVPLPSSIAGQLADLAVQVLIDEADLSPKPGLVDRRSNGAHTDLNLGLMHSSAYALRQTFQDMAEAASVAQDLDQSLRETLGQLGRKGESVMLETTGGVNTHRGAIWALGLLTAAAAFEPEHGSPTDVAHRAALLARQPDRFAPEVQNSHGLRACARYGLPGAREQAQAGFPAVVGHGLPQLLKSRAKGAGEQNARLDALIAIMAVLPDTCVLHRAGLEGLDTLQHGAQAVLAQGGSATLAGRRALRQLDDALLRLNASPGGAADLLAATLFLDRLESCLQRSAISWKP